MKVVSILSLLLLLYTTVWSQEIDSGSTDEVFVIVEQPAEPVGGYAEFYKFISSNVLYPETAIQNCVEGKVFVQFVVNRDGSVDQVKAIRGIGAGCDEEAIRVISMSGNWNPARHEGKVVKQQLTIPVLFTFAEDCGSLNSNYEKVSGSYKEALFPGGTSAMREFIKEKKVEPTVELPPNRHRNTVKVRFDVDSTGSIKNIELANSLAEEFDWAAIELVRKMPRWVPAQRGGKNVDSSASVNIEFGNIPFYEVVDANNFYLDGMKLYKEGDKNKAIKLYTKAIDSDPTVLDYYLKRGAASIEIGKVRSGCRDLDLIKDDEEAISIYNANCQ